MEKTVPYTDLNLEVTGYMLNAELNDTNQAAVTDLQEKLKDQFGEQIYTLPPESLHVTLMDWIAPLTDYKDDKDVLFNRLFDEYDEALADILGGTGEINIKFTDINVSAGAIFLTGQDDGQFQTIRENFTDRIELLPGTKQPPSIIHTTIARFMNEVNIEVIQEFVSGLSVNFVQPVTEFRLVNEKKIPMLEYDLVKLYQVD